MEIMRSIVRGLLAFAIGLLASAWIMVGTVTFTIANRDVVKHWLESSGVYNNALAKALEVTPETETSDSIITPDILQQALVQTFDAAYVRQSANQIIDATYNWLEGSASNISFAITVQEKAEAFRQNVSTLIIPKLEALPPCPGRVTADTTRLTCLPAGMSAADYAAQLTRPSGDNTFLNQPLTEKAFEQGVPHLGWLPMAFGWLRTAFWALPLAVVTLGALFVLLSPDKMAGVGRLGRQLTINAIISLAIGGFLWIASGAVDLSQAVEGSDPAQTKLVAELMNPLMRTILPDIGRALTVCSGVVVLVGGLMWLGEFLWNRRTPKHPMSPPPRPTPPAASLPQPKPPVRKIDL